MNKCYIESRTGIPYIPTLKIRKANLIGHILHGNCLVKHVVEGMIEVKGRRGRRLDDLKETRGYWK